MDILKQHLKTSIRKLKLGCKLVFQMDNDTKHTSKVVEKWLRDNKVKVLEWPSQSSDLNPIVCGILHYCVVYQCVGRTEKACASKEAYKLDSSCQKEWAKIHPTYCGKVVEGYQKHLTQVKQFKDPLGM